MFSLCVSQPRDIASAVPFARRIEVTDKIYREALPRRVPIIGKGLSGSV